MRCPVTVLAFALLAGGCAAHAPESQWVRPGPDGKLVYKTTDRGDRIMDFSFAGYEGGGVALPDVPVPATVRPTGTDDDTPTIQAAIDQVSALPPGKDGFRGAVLLAQGTFTCPATLNLTTPGVVLRGSGSGDNGTTIRMAGPKHVAVAIGSGKASAPRSATRTTITDRYVPAGTSTFTVADAAGLAVGDTIDILRPTTAAWVHFMGMDTLRRDGEPQTWVGVGRNEVSERRITGLSGNKITIDVPLADSYDAAYLNPPGTTVAKVTPGVRRVNHVGVEHLRIACPPLEIDYGHAPYSAVRVGGDDCWVRDVRCEETMNSTVLAGRRITMERVVIHHTYTNLGASKPTDFSIEGSQILIDRCHVTGGNTYFVWTSSVQPGPNVVLNSTFRGHGSRIQPHQRWSTALLVDNCTAPDGGIDFMNRGVAGSGHGWTMGWGVAWNCVAKTYVIQNPPGVVNWAIGCIGQRVQTARLFDTSPVLPEGTFDSHGTPVALQSLYLAQLQERLGPQALKNIGYASNALAEFPDKSTPPLPPLPAEEDPALGPDLALHRPVNGTAGRGEGREFALEKAVDADPATAWSPADDKRHPTIEVDMEGPVDINALAIEEAPDAAGRIKEYKVEAQVDSDWTLLAHGTTVGARHVDHFPKVTAWKVRLTILKSDGEPALRKFGLYLAR